LFFDVEATCEEGGGFAFPNEIIEFPVILVDGETFEIVCKMSKNGLKKEYSQ
jgi:3'-5' exoribonuclease 1